MTHKEYLVRKRGYGERAAEAYERLVQSMPSESNYDFSLLSRRNSVLVTVSGFRAKIAEMAEFVYNAFPDAELVSVKESSLYSYNKVVMRV